MDIIIGILTALVIWAIEKYGRRQALSHVHILTDLAQTEATVEWAIRELHRETVEFEDKDSYIPALSRLLPGWHPRVRIARRRRAPFLRI